jgi:glycosyltransferase involved in cell wall biosynthesis
MKLSIVIPCYNGADTLGLQLEALAAQRWDQPWEVIVADNGSTDMSREVAASFAARFEVFRLVDASRRKGQPYALNTGAEEANGVSVVFCDADDVVGPGWVTAIGEALDRHDFVASRFDFEKLNSAMVVRARRNEQADGLQNYRTPPFLPHAGGCGLGVRRELLLGAGGFDEALPALHDTDLCWRLQLQGVSLHFVADALIHVRFRETMSGIYRQAKVYGEYDVLLYKKYRKLGMPTVSLRKPALAWLSLVWKLASLRGEEARLAWARQLGRRMGRMRGSIRFRTLAP